MTPPTTCRAPLRYALLVALSVVVLATTADAQQVALCIGLAWPR